MCVIFCEPSFALPLESVTVCTFLAVFSRSFHGFLKQFSQTMPRVRSSRRAPSRSTQPSAPLASDEITEASLRALSVYDLRHRCTNAGLDNSGRKADLVARLLEHHNVSSQPGPSTSGQPPLQRNNEDQSRLLDHTLRDTIRSEVTACVTAAVQNLLPSSSSTIDITGNAGLLRSTHGQIGSTSVSLPTVSDHTLGGLTADVRRYADLAIAPSTRRAYSVGQRRFMEFCHLHRLEPLPATDFTLSSFAAFLTRSVKPGTIKAYLSAVRNMHVEHGYPDPTLNAALLQRVMRGIGRVHGSEVARPRLPITMPVLVQLLRALQGSRHYRPADKAMLKAAMLLAFHGFLRCGEFTAPPVRQPGLWWPRRQDMEVCASPPSLRYHLRRSKTDRDGNGVVIHVGPSAPEVCPVISMAAYFAGSPASPTDHLFVYDNGIPLRRASFVNDVRHLLAVAGTANLQLYAGHSFRIGAATSAALCGIPEGTIRAMGRWKSDCVHRYIRTDPATFHRVASRLSAVARHS